MSFPGFKTLLLAILLTACTLQAATAETLSIRADLWPPYNDEPKSNKPGYMIVVLMEIFLRQGYQLDYQTLSWEDSLEAVRRGQFNAVVGASKDDAPTLSSPGNRLASATRLFLSIQKENGSSTASILSRRSGLAS